MSASYYRRTPGLRGMLDSPSGEPLILSDFNNNDNEEEGEDVVKVDLHNGQGDRKRLVNRLRNEADVVSRHAYPMYAQGPKYYFSRRRLFSVLLVLFLMWDFVWTFDALVALSPWLGIQKANATINTRLLWMPVLQRSKQPTHMVVGLSICSLVLHAASCCLSGALMEYNRRLHLSNRYLKDFDKSIADVGQYKKADIKAAKFARSVVMTYSLLQAVTIPIELSYLSAREASFKPHHLLVFVKSVLIIICAMKHLEIKKYIESVKKSPRNV